MLLSGLINEFFHAEAQRRKGREEGVLGWVSSKKFPNVNNSPTLCASAPLREIKPQTDMLYA
ncbi:hypothetical protein A2T98_18855 [Nodularia spumigena CENA596]|uniref:Uncharacterized protein n=1 Tax=Nodularia spumigena CENA596 TaxID=1819295 RepID=A0A166IER9_NODSP|nr:hypothetical protein A2T98_18855 [Nodularia spumigena CENA596]